MLEELIEKLKERIKQLEHQKQNGVWGTYHQDNLDFLMSFLAVLEECKRERETIDMAMYWLEKRNEEISQELHICEKKLYELGIKK